MEINEKLTRHFEETLREYNDPEIMARKKAKRKKEEQLKEIEEDLGL